MNAAFSSGRHRATIARPSVTLLCLEPSRVKAPYAVAVGRAVAVVEVPLPLLPLLGRAAARGSMKRARYVMRSLAAVGNSVAGPSHIETRRAFALAPPHSPEVPAPIHTHAIHGRCLYVLPLE